MKWNGRRLIPVGAIPVYPKRQDDIRELLKPLSEKRDRGNVWVPVLNQPINVQKEPTPQGSPTPTPTKTLTPTPTPSQTFTPTPTETPTPTPTIPFDSDAASYLSAVVTAGGTGITDTVSAATSTLFYSLKAAGVYSKLLALYPMLGGNAAGCKFNAINPVDSDAAYRLQFINNPTYSMSGVNFASVAYADTKLNPAQISVLTATTQISMGTYLNRGPVNNDDNYSIGATVTPSSDFTSWDYGLAKQICGKAYGNTCSLTVTPTGTTTGLVQMTCDGSNSIIKFYNSQESLSDTDIKRGTGLPNCKIYLGALSLNNSVYGPADCRIATSFIGQSLTDQQMIDVNNAFQTFNTTLSRQV